MARQKLMTKELLNKVPALYAQDGKGDDAIVYAHYFSPSTGWDWYMMEYSPEENLGYGLCCGFEKEFGYFSLDEFEQMNDKFFNDPNPTFRSIWIEREYVWRERTLGELKKEKGMVA